MTPLSDDLRELARLHGVDTSYTAWDGTPLTVGSSAVVGVLAALDVDASSPELVRLALAQARSAAAERLLPPCVVARAGRDTSVPVPPGARLWIGLEAGGRLEVAGGVLPELPLGYHSLELTTADGRSARAALISAPARVRTPAEKSWGYTVQLYSALSRRSWGMGDLGDLAELAQWSGRGLGAGFVLVNPLHTMLPAASAGHSPYWPSSRRYSDPVHVRIEDVPEFGYLDAAGRRAAEGFAERAGELRARVLDGNALIDRDAVWEVKRQALELLFKVGRGPGRQAVYEEFLRREGLRLDDFATYRALAGRHGADWREWPAELRDPRGAAVARARGELAEEVEFHRWLAWTVDQQLQSAQRAAKDAGMAVGVVHDLAVGVHPGGADTWALQELFAPGMTVGAPPDAFTAQGQDWQQPPWRPDRLAQAGYEPFADLLRGVLRHAGALRMDHVLGLFRLWWVPRGRPLSEGAYVRYDHEAMLAVLALEAHRAGAMVIGEDLGTVEDGVRELLADHGVLGTSVLWFEQDEAGRPLPARQWREGCLATVTTHDLPSTAARLDGLHLELLDQHGMLNGPLEEERAAAVAEIRTWQEELRRTGLLADDGASAQDAAPSGPSADTLALHRYLARTPARLMGVWLPDAVGDVRSQNLPGTFDEHPNWQHVIADGAGRPVTLEDLAEAPGPVLLADALTPTGTSTARPLTDVAHNNCFERLQ
ncbi:4-alpha-glucanotransferase (plasmid) [Streptomyces sp. NBC_00868]|uniref:4-alpha-glucanotransferase n=1 Tax=Streptomyces sp. NBC_00868 TaxID=2903683 RepID=UPI002F915690|nr:4-alpha-glucanotransferase [Streptomyces sp. NBC_00868]